MNLERPLLATGRLHGHVVQGHVDGTDEFSRLDLLGDNNYWLRIRIPGELDRYIVYKGSDRYRRNQPDSRSDRGYVLAVTIIPHTYEMTALTKRAGPAVESISNATCSPSIWRR